MTDQEIEPDAVIDSDAAAGEPLATVIKGKAEPENYDLTVSTYKGYGSNIKYHELTGEQMFSSETILQLWIDDYKPSLLGEAEILRERGEDDVAAQIEHAVERFEEVFSQ